MADYEVEITAVFSNSKAAGQFAREFEEDMGHSPERSGSTVTCLVYRHGDEAVMKERATAMGGKVNVRVLKDEE